MAAVDERTGAITVREKRPLAEVSRGYTSFTDGDVLFAKITPCMENGKVVLARNLTNGTGRGSTEFYVLRPGDRVLGEYIYHFVRQARFREEARRNFTGTAGQQRVPKSFMENVLVPLPPLDEQRRIAGILNRAACIERLRAQTADLLREFVPALFIRMFGDPVENLLGWEVLRVDQIGEVASGAGFPKKEQGAQAQKYPFLKVSDMNLPGNETSIKSWNNSICEETRKKLRAKVFPDDSIIFPKIGAAIATNKKRLLTRPSCVDNNIMVITPGPRLHSDYLLGLLLHKNLSEFASEADPPSMRKTTVEDWDIPLPPLALQRQYAGIVAAARGIATAAECAGKAASTLGESLMVWLLGESG